MHINFDLDIMTSAKYLVREICNKDQRIDIILLLTEKVLDYDGESLIHIILYEAIKSNHLALGSDLCDSLGIMLFERSSPGSLTDAIAQKMTIDQPTCKENIAWFNDLISEHLGISADEWEKDCLSSFTFVKTI